MKKIVMPLEIIIVSLVQILLSISLSFRFPFLLLLLIPGILILFPRNWIRILSLIGYFSLLSLSATVLVYSLAAVENKIGQPAIVIAGSIFFFIFFMYIAICLLFKQKIKQYYIEGSRAEMLSGTRIPTQWICPKCNSKIRFSVKCWNCGEPKPGSETIAGSEAENPQISPDNEKTLADPGDLSAENSDTAKTDDNR